MASINTNPKEPTIAARLAVMPNAASDSHRVWSRHCPVAENDKRPLPQHIELGTGDVEDFRLTDAFSPFQGCVSYAIEVRLFEDLFDGLELLCEGV